MTQYLRVLSILPEHEWATNLNSYSMTQTHRNKGPKRQGIEWENLQWEMKTRSKENKSNSGDREALHKFMTYAKHIYWDTLFAGGNIPKVSRALSHTMLAKRTQTASETSAYRLIITAQLEGLVPPQWFLWGTVSSPRLALTSQLDKDTELKFPLSFHQGFWEKNPIQNTIKSAKWRISNRKAEVKLLPFLSNMVF